MSTYTAVVALHIIAVIAAYGLPLSAPMVVPHVRRRHPDALPGLHAAQHFVNNAITGPFTVLLLAFGIYLALPARPARGDLPRNRGPAHGLRDGDETVLANRLGSAACPSPRC